MNSFAKKGLLLRSLALILVVLLTFTSCAEVGDIFGDFANSLLTNITTEGENPTLTPTGTSSPQTTASNPGTQVTPPSGDAEIPAVSDKEFTVNDIPAYDKKAYVEINGNVPFFYYFSLKIFKTPLKSLQI